MLCSRLDYSMQGRLSDVLRKLESHRGDKPHYFVALISELSDCVFFASIIRSKSPSGKNQRPKQESVADSRLAFDGTTAPTD